MNVVADFTMDVWVETVATMGVVAVEFIGAVGVWVVGMDWAITLTLYFLLVSMVFILLSLNLGFGAFVVIGLIFWRGALVLGSGWVWGWGLGLGPSLPSNSRYIIIFGMRQG